MNLKINLNFLKNI